MLGVMVDSSSDPEVPETWVIGVDGSDSSAHALAWAVARARDAAVRGVVVTLRAIAVWRMPAMAPFGVGGTTMMIQWDDLEAAMTQQLENVVAAADTDAVQIVTETARGGAAGALVEASRDAALLIVGSRGHSALRDLVLGSVSRQCCTHAEVPVVVVPLDAALDAPTTVIVGVDGSDRSIAAVEWVLGRGASLMGAADLEALGAFDRSPFEEAELTRDRFGDEVAEAEAQFHRLLDGIDPDRRMARRYSLHGARRALAAAVSGVESPSPPHDARGRTDLVVLGARGHGVIGSALLGSVSNWMLHHLDCPTVIVPS
jgi:nucleotide-binding universal stress UspA family protein